ncbi:glycosyltransferase [Marivita geojedonensis]|uniref:glycosyltransferase n=1 Tax=Marivita geojedonensis TaxID=1123756 RepID=UPI000A1F6693|nr:glycosyltransferase [Marivita geojedonensis]PRY73900.1 glycosyltransferase involved in cell wall biosynthesis [Marivita geojedonensis]
MRVLIDLQCVQYEPLHHRMGSFLLGFVDALLPASTTAGHDVQLLLNSAFPKTVPVLQRRYPDLCKTRRIHVFDGLQKTHTQQDIEAWRSAASALIRDFAIAGLSPDLIVSPVPATEGQITGVGSGLVLSNTPNLMLLQDPGFKEILKSNSDTNPNFENHPAAVQRVLSASDGMMVLSETAYQDALEASAFPAENLHIISQDVGPQFAPPDHMSLDDMAHLRARHALHRPYMLCVAADDCADSMANLIAAYGALPKGMIERHALVIIGDLSGEGANSLHRVAKSHAVDAAHIRILTHVSDADLPGLYGLAELFIAPCSGEHFGRQALEAIRCGTLTLGANCSGLPDVIGTSETLFEPMDSSQLSSLILKSLTHKDFRAVMQDRQKRHSAQFSWQMTAQKALSVFSEYAQTQTTEPAWTATQTRLDALEDHAITALKRLPRPGTGMRDQDHKDLARALARTRKTAEDFWRPRDLKKTDLNWRLEGPFDSTYSLASVNRETARALEKRGINVALVSAEGDGPFDPDPDFLHEHSDLAMLHRSGDKITPEAADIVSRNMFPPRVSDMRAPLNLLHGYAWEETGLPQAFTRDMTDHLQGLLVTSPHVKKLFEDAGVGLPVHVVGNGVDHLDVPHEALPFALPQAELTCLHVSSCFPRKGADVLLKAFAEAFAGDDGVQLLIKTFPNPHNDIASQIRTLKKTHPDLPQITILDDALTPGQMRSLYVASDLLIAPSRAEGYCLPVAEAVLAGTPVLTTGWGGQKVFSGNPLVHFIDYKFEPAQSHLDTWDSVWAEPDTADLVQKLKAFRTTPKPGPDDCEKAANEILSQHSWEQVAKRSDTAVRHIASRAPCPPPKVGWISSYNTRCGIATYSAHLIGTFPDEVTVFASHSEDRITSDEANIRRCWRQDGHDTLAHLQAEIRTSDPQVLVIQFNYGFFNFPHLGALILRAKAEGRNVVMMLHATDDTPVPPERHLARIRPALEACDRLLVHSHHDLNHLKSLGLVENVALFPHGVPYAKVPPSPPITPDRPVVLGTYGFFLPPKGLDRLIEAVAQLRNQGENVALEMINAEFPIKDSAEAIGAARQQIRALELDQYVNLETGFLDDEESFSRLARADALVFSYQKTAESASGAIRQALALDRPVLATPLRIFDDVEPLIMRLPGTTAEAIAQGLKPVIRALRDPETEPTTARQLNTIRENANRWRQSHAYQVLGPRLWRQICSLTS